MFDFYINPDKRHGKRQTFSSLKDYLLLYLLLNHCSEKEKEREGGALIERGLINGKIWYFETSPTGQRCVLIVSLRGQRRYYVLEIRGVYKRQINAVYKQCYTTVYKH